MHNLWFSKLALQSAGQFCTNENYPEVNQQETTFTCFFNPDDDFKLSIRVIVPEIHKLPQHDWDTREITLISSQRFSTQGKESSHNIF